MNNLLPRLCTKDWVREGKQLRIECRSELLTTEFAVEWGTGQVICLVKGMMWDSQSDWLVDRFSERARLTFEHLTCQSVCILPYRRGPNCQTNALVKTCKNCVWLEAAKVQEPAKRYKPTNYQISWSSITLSDLKDASQIHKIYWYCNYMPQCLTENKSIRKSWCRVYPAARTLYTNQTVLRRNTKYHSEVQRTSLDKLHTLAVWFCTVNSKWGDSSRPFGRCQQGHGADLWCSFGQLVDTCGCHLLIPPSYLRQCRWWYIYPVRKQNSPCFLQTPTVPHPTKATSYNGPTLTKMQLRHPVLGHVLVGVCGLTVLGLSFWVPRHFTNRYTSQLTQCRL
jgi:hypothetical protein